MAPLTPSARPGTRAPSVCLSRCTAVCGSRSARARRRSPGGMRRRTEARRSRPPTHPPPGSRPARRRPGCQHRPAPRGGGRRRALQTDSSSRRRGAELDSPLSAGTRKRFFSGPHPTPPPAPPQPPSLAELPPPSAESFGWVTASPSRWGRVGFQGSLKSKRRPSDAQAEPAGGAAGAPRRAWRRPGTAAAGGSAGRCRGPAQAAGRLKALQDPAQRPPPPASLPQTQTVHP